MRNFRHPAGYNSGFDKGADFLSAPKSYIMRQSSFTESGKHVHSRD